LPGTAKKIDAHTHVAPQWAEMAVRVMDACQVECSVTLGWQDAFGEALDRMLTAFARYPGRFAQLMNLDWRGIDSPGWDESQADELERAVEQGCAGLKIFKDLGLEVRDKTGGLIRVDDRRLDKVFERAGRLDVPVLIHTADPVWFWRPLNERNFFRGLLEGGYEHWLYYRTGVPSSEELLGERDNLLARHRGTRFVAAHLASLAEDPLAFEETLASHPNLFADISARLPMMARTVRRKELWADILSSYPHRILFGTDLIYLDSDVASGIQSQSFQRPEDLDLDPSASAEQTYEQTSIAYTLSHFEFLGSDKVQPRAPFRREEGSFALHGLGLEPDIVKRIEYQTPQEVYRLG
jgi:predicted TIM-barrel fold metal-dependent hydrolase